jgi:signal transduction histidine kinase
MRRVRLRTLLIVLILVTTLPVAAFAAWVIWRSTAQQAALIDAQNIEQARAVLVAIDQEIEATIASLNVLAMLEPVDEPDKTRFSQIAARVLPLHPGWQSIRLVDPSLNVLSNTAGPPSDSPLLDPDWVHEVVRTGRSAISTARRDPVSGQWVVSIGVPVNRGSRLKYVLGVRLYARMFGDILRRQKAPVDGVVTLLDRQPVIIARTRNEDRYVGQAPTADFVQRSRRASEGSWQSVLLEGTAAYSAWSRSARTGWTVGIGLPAQPIDGPVRRSFIALVAGGLASTAAGLLLAMLLGRRLIRAQTAATAAAVAVARGEPMTSFDSRIAEAHDLAEGLREAAAILDTRLRERDRAQAEADRHRAALLERETQARQQAEALSRAKDEFIATVSHELRTPLNAIFGWVAMLRTGTLDAKRQAHAFDVIDRNTRAQAQLIEDILDMSRAIQGNIQLVMERVDLAAVLESAIESLRPTAEARRLTIQVQAPRRIAFVTGDPRRVQQVLWNILSNAMKFTGPGGRIDVTLETQDGDALVRISDSGEGIAPEFLPHVFERFRQENPAVTRTHSGLGLGLSLARHIVELHGGTIAVASDGKGRGATFTITLPLVRSVGSPGVAAASSDARNAIDIHRLRGRRVLVVDAGADARELAAEALGQAGALVVTADSPADAIAAIDVRVPDAVVAAIEIATADEDFAHRLRRNPRTAAVPLLAMSDDDGAEAHMAAEAAGFHGCMRTPYEPAALAARVASLLVA